MKRVSLFCGHFGSGKTNIAVNYALRLRAAGRETAIADLDIVNPYFRTVDSAAALEAAGVQVFGLPFANTNLDLPSLPSEIYGLVQTRKRAAVIDVGGDERGVLALGRFAPYILEEDDYDMFYVVNFRRPLTRDAESALEVLREIEAATPLRFTAIVNNTNLGQETTAGTVEESGKEAARLAALAALPIAFTAYDRRLSPAPQGENMFPLRLQRSIAAQ